MSSLTQKSIPELMSLFEIVNLPAKEKLHEYFTDVMNILNSYFPITYSALFIHDHKKDSLHLEALYGIDHDIHPTVCSSKKGTVGKVIGSQKPMVIQNLSQEPLYEEMSKKKGIIEKINPPLLCMPIVGEDFAIGVININSLGKNSEEFSLDFQFLTVLQAILCPKIERYIRSKTNSYLLDEILERKLNEFLDKVDPYVEAKGKMGLLDDIISLVERILINSALKKVDYVQTAASELLGINRNTLRKKLKDLKIKIPKA